jgi:hypothetical protein
MYYSDVYLSEVRMGLRSTRIFFAINVLLLAAIACQGQAFPTATFTPRPAGELTMISVLKTQTAEDSAASTAIPIDPASSNVPVTEAPAGPADSAPVSIPTTAIPSVSPTDTLIPAPVIPPTDTLIPSPVVPLASVSSETNCRTGPSQYYKLVGRAAVGTKFTVVGKNTPTNYWIIRLPDGRECWLWGQYASLEGNINSLPEYNPPTVGRIEGEVRRTSLANAAKVAQAFVDIGLGFAVVQTGNDGVFVFEDVPMGEVKISVIYSGLNFPKRSVFVNPGQVVTAIMIPIPPPFVPPAITPPPFTPTPTRRPLCPILRPNCLFLPTFAPALPGVNSP